MIVHTPSMEKLFDSVLLKKRDLIQVIVGPRQVGKTTAAKEIQKKLSGKCVEYSADEPFMQTSSFLKGKWYEAFQDEECEMLIVDEVQKIENWSEVVKSLWDSRQRTISVLLLGSSSFEIHKGLSESLAGRFYLHKFYHWNFLDSRELKANLTLENYLLYGGYPKSYDFLESQDSQGQWLNYIKYSVIEPVILRDLLSAVRVKSPALFKRCFDLICSIPAQVISYTKILGQLQSKGNTDLVKNYICLFEAAFLVRSLEKYSGSETSKKTSSPKLFPLCPAFYSVIKDGVYDSSDFGRAFEVSVGQYLNTLPGALYYWREKDLEVDFVYEFQKDLYAIEVKYGGYRSTPGLDKFLEKYPRAKPLIVTPDNFEKLLQGKLIKDFDSKDQGNLFNCNFLLTKTLGDVRFI